MLILIFHQPNYTHWLITATIKNKLYFFRDLREQFSVKYDYL